MQFDVRVKQKVKGSDVVGAIVLVVCDHDRNRCRAHSEAEELASDADDPARRDVALGQVEHQVSSCTDRVDAESSSI